MNRSFTIVFLFASLFANAQTTSILFLGNSYTYTADLPGTLYNLAVNNGDTIYHESNTPAGYTFQGHSTNATSLNKIASRDWDFVVLQEQSQIPSFSPNQVANDCYPYAQILVDSIRSNYECTEPVFFMTWGRQAGDQQNCQFYPPVCTFEGMNGRLRQSYLEMGLTNEATVAPCGAAWGHMALTNNFFWSGLYSGDGSHPSAWGTYLNACVFYATIFRKSPVGITYYSSIGQQDAEDLQELAEAIVLDSLSHWYVGHADVIAADEHSANQLMVSFNSTSVNANGHFWDFGDGSTSQETNPVHTYAAADTYTVMHVASSNCDSDNSYSEVTVTGPSGIEDSNALNSVVLNRVGEGVSIDNPLGIRIQFELIDFTGRSIVSRQIEAVSTELIELPSTSNIYLIRLTDGRNLITRKFGWN
jgi:hypothetical protein